MVKFVLTFLLVMIVIALISGPAFRRVIARILGLPPRR